MNHDNKRNGFTLIELMIAMGFVAALLLAIALTVMQIGNMYNRGITLREVNQAGRSISSELQKTISQSASFSLLPVHKKYIIVTDASGTIGGRLCIGQYSYIWNFGKYLGSAISGVSKYNGNDIRFAKVSDSAGAYCVLGAVGYPDVPASAEVVELLGSGDRDLAIHAFSIQSIESDTQTGQQIYKIKFTIGTNDEASIDSSYLSCKAPNQPGTSDIDASYCAINWFDIIVRAGNMAG